MRIRGREGSERLQAPCLLHGKKSMGASGDSEGALGHSDLCLLEKLENMRE